MQSTLGCSGATLLELLTVLGVLGLLLGYTQWPSIGAHALTGSSVALEAAQLTSLVQHARARAFETKQNLELRFDLKAVELVDSGGAILQKHHLGRGVRLESARFGLTGQSTGSAQASASNQAARFWPNATQSAGTVVLNSVRSGEQCIITVSLRGALRTRCIV